MAASKRTQVLLREPIQKLIEQLSERDRVSVSKTVGRLVEEALAARGLLQAEAVQSISPLGLVLPEGVQVSSVANRRTVAGTAAPAGQPSPFKQMEEQIITRGHIADQVPALREEPAPVTSQPTEVEADDNPDLAQIQKLFQIMKMAKEAGVL